MVIIIKPGTDILFLEELQTERTKLKPLYGKGDFFCSVTGTHQLFHCKVKVVKLFIVGVCQSHFKCPAA